MSKSFRTHLMSMGRIILSDSAVNFHASQAYLTIRITYVIRQHPSNTDSSRGRGEEAMIDALLNICNKIMVDSRMDRFPALVSQRKAT
ncbi:hypothetical protein PoB_006005400 [Plakobranchus ocellatus]|uniref:Uncharacterized protein n=1 Tax=Plakobranchus ocellatus TaxID=259542 RepID=A0AAV4CNV2_9GAST|nr:hypothetical protein PoB_006005400 [Plakobranchus ocellatus]